MGSMVYSENGTASLVPYAMPQSMDENGNEERQGRYCIAYSRDGWWLIDSEKMLALRWCVSEDDAVRAREGMLRS